MNPLITFICLRKNPYPLVLRCLKDSGLTAFFTRSSAANIPVNMKLCKDLGLDEDTYSISIPLGATINMAGAAITISTMARAAAHTLGIRVDFPTALILCILAAASAAGASGVAGGSSPSDSDCLQPLRNPQRRRHASSWCRIHRRRYPGFLRNRTELIYRRTLYSNRRDAYTEITMRNTLREFLKLSRQAPRSRASTDFGSLLA